MEIHSEMLSLIHRQLKPRITWQRRFLTQGLLPGQSSSTPPPMLLVLNASVPKNLNEKAYYVPRNSRGNLPVYSDIKNAGSRPLVHIRNVEGNISVRLSPVPIPAVVCNGFLFVCFRRWQKNCRSRYSREIRLKPPS